MILKEILKDSSIVHSNTKDATIADVARQMHENRVGSIIIVDDSNRVEGIVTDRDIAMVLALDCATADSYIVEAMTSAVDTITQTMNLFEVARFFRTIKYKRLPVVDNDNRLVGVVSSDDVIAVLVRELYDTCTVMAPKLGHAI
jgi:CBS domain-containing protein